jgi:hypothetical protein
MVRTAHVDDVLSTTAGAGSFMDNIAVSTHDIEFDPNDSGRKPKRLPLPRNQPRRANALSRKCSSLPSAGASDGFVSLIVTGT